MYVLSPQSTGVDQYGQPVYATYVAPPQPVVINQIEDTKVVPGVAAQQPQLVQTTVVKGGGGAGAAAAGKSTALPGVLFRARKAFDRYGRPTNQPFAPGGCCGACCGALAGSCAACCCCCAIM